MCSPSFTLRRRRTASSWPAPRWCRPATAIWPRSALRAGPFGEPSQAIEAQGLAQARHDVQRAAALARAGDRDAARRTLITAYLDHFEPHEAVLRGRDASLVNEIESAFLSLRS